MNILQKLRRGQDGIVVGGIHEPILQSIVDFDYLAGKKRPSIRAIVTGTRTAYKLFFGPSEVLIPCFSSIESIPASLRLDIAWFLSLESGRRACDSVTHFFEQVPHALGAHIFAENVPEVHATKLLQRFLKTYSIFGPSGVGFLVSGFLKLGAIGGVSLEQIHRSHITEKGSIAVCSTSGGMTNELIHAVSDSGRRVSFAACVGGDRFPVFSLTDAFTLAESDPNTDAVVYFGELGGDDEYEIITLIEEKRFTKPLVAYIAGVIDEAFEEHVQFGHAKALVRKNDESARAKRSALRDAGVHAPDTFSGFLKAIDELSVPRGNGKMKKKEMSTSRQKTILTTRKITGIGALPKLVSGKKITSHGGTLFVPALLEALLGRPPKSNVTVAYTDAVFRLLIDHGGHVSGAVNTMITARAGRDMATSLSAGLLTIGSRFGGAVNAAAGAWLSGVSRNISSADFVSEWGKRREPIPGIGHKKYRLGIPDPRVLALMEFKNVLKKHPHSDFAQSIEKITVRKKGTLILNIDGAISALFLDILSEKEGLTNAELQTLVRAEFFNAFFILPRSVGFVAHFLEQKKNDEGLFRLPDELLHETDTSSHSRIV
ncbi:hypothetical protein K2P56_01545 [Patescibacteria group bacterium]|nr:hypothetical protein [Patescibacteria group bacterium]